MDSVRLPKHPAQPPGPGRYLQIHANTSEGREATLYREVPSSAKEPLPFLSARGDRVCIAHLKDPEFSTFRVVGNSSEIADVIRVGGLDVSRVQWLSADLAELQPLLSAFDGPAVEREHRERIVLFVDDPALDASHQFWCERGLVLGCNPTTTILVSQQPDGIVIGVLVRAQLLDGVLLPHFLQGSRLDVEMDNEVAETVAAGILAALDRYDDAAVLKVRGKLTGFDSVDRGPLALLKVEGKWAEPGTDLMAAIRAAFDLPTP